MASQDASVQKLFDEIQQKAAFSQQQLAIVKNQITSKQRELRMSELTVSEMSTLDQGTRVYEGVGKMFMATSLPEVKTRLAENEEELKKELANLDKKSTYLMTTFKNSNEHLEKILRNGGR